MAWCGNFDFDDLMSPGDPIQRQSKAPTISNPHPGGMQNKQNSYNNYQTQSFRSHSSNQGTMTLSDLSPGVPGVQISGVIIAKDNPRSFPNKKEPGKERHVLSFTLRDSPNDFSNVTCWGEEDYIMTLGQQFHIGDVVDIQQFVVQSKPMDGTDERFKPSTPTMCQLIVSEKRSTIKHSSGLKMSDLSGLIHTPVKTSNDYYTISDILTNGQQLHGEIISIMAVVKSVSAVKNMVSKMGRPLKHCEVRLLDETASHFLLKLWSDEMINMAQQWTPMDNVIFAADVRVTHDEYRKTMVASANTKTIITANPDTKEAHRLYQYAQSVEIDNTMEESFVGGGDANIDLSTIETVYNVNQLKNLQNNLTAEGGTDYGIVYAHISQFNIDGDAPVTVIKCTKCRRRVDTVTGMCVNINCPQGSATLGGDVGDDLDTQSIYNINMQLTDQSGTLTSCSLTPEAAQNMLQMPVDRFLGLEEQEKTNLKWRYLLERCKVYLKIILPTYDRPQISFKVLSCTHADLQEAVRFLQ